MLVSEVSKNPLCRSPLLWVSWGCYGTCFEQSWGRLWYREERSRNYAVGSALPGRNDEEHYSDCYGRGSWSVRVDHCHPYLTSNPLDRLCVLHWLLPFLRRDFMRLVLGSLGFVHWRRWRCRRAGQQSADQDVRSDGAHSRLWLQSRSIRFNYWCCAGAKHHAVHRRVKILFACLCCSSLYSWPAAVSICRLSARVVYL